MLFIKSLLTKICFVSFIALTLIGCQPTPRGENEIYIGTIAGPETELMEKAQEVLQNKFNITLKIVEFEDYTLPNAALAEGAIDANMFQHQPYLDVIVQTKHYAIESIGKTFVYPMGIYSKQYDHIAQLPAKAIIGIPNDPSNGARALRLLASAHLIKLRDKRDIELTKHDITYNPKNFNIKEMDAAQLPRLLQDVDAAIINTNYAVPAGLIPSKDALFLESSDSPYANIVAIRTQEKGHQKFSYLMEALHSEEVGEVAEKLFQGQALPAW